MLGDKTGDGRLPGLLSQASGCVFTLYCSPAKRICGNTLCCRIPPLSRIALAVCYGKWTELRVSTAPEWQLLLLRYGVANGR